MTEKRLNHRIAMISDTETEKNIKLQSRGKQIQINTLGSWLIRENVQVIIHGQNKRDHFIFRKRISPKSSCNQKIHSISKTFKVY